jgi:hypothetical protein
MPKDVPSPLELDAWLLKLVSELLNNKVRAHDSLSFKIVRRLLPLFGDTSFVSDCHGSILSFSRA